MNCCRKLTVICLAALVSPAGCWFGQSDFRFPEHQVGPHETVATQIEYPDVESTMRTDIATSKPPRALENPHDQQALDMSLADAMRLAMSNSEVIRNLGGSVVSAPAGSQTMFNPAIIESDPRTSVEAALSAFDAQFTSSLFWNKFNRPVNQTFDILFLPTIQRLQSTGVFELGKTTATGARFAVRHHVNYDRNDIFNRSLRFQSVWDIDYEAEYRQPLLQGAGVEFNRIAGPNAVAGGPGGVLLARLNTDVSLADFEASVTNLVRDVEQAYWDLYFAYRDLDAKLAGRDSALADWRGIVWRIEYELPGGTSDSEALTRSQYFSFQAAVEDALATLYAREERLRYMLGLPPNGPELIRPSTEPSTARVIFPWHSVLNEAYIRRVELRRQKWQIKRRELELIAARNFLKPRLDAVALYRWRGFGDHLIAAPGRESDESAYQNMTAGDYQEWQLGVQLDIPIGFRREFAALRNAELQLARDRALLREQEFRVSHDLSDAIRNVQRAFQLMKTNLNRRVAAFDEVQALGARLDEGIATLEVVLRARQRLAESNSAYYRSLVDYSLAIRDVHLAKGSLLEYDGVSLAEGPWSTDAYRDALQRSRHFAPRLIDYGLSRPIPLSRGPYLQEGGPMNGSESNADQGGAESLPTPAGEPLPMPGQVLGDELVPPDKTRGG